MNLAVIVAFSVCFLGLSLTSACRRQREELEADTSGSDIAGQVSRAFTSFAKLSINLVDRSFKLPSLMIMAACFHGGALNSPASIC
jgi:hypothetical protein